VDTPVMTLLLVFSAVKNASVLCPGRICVDSQVQ
jgi:hypothetical protein